MLTSVSAMAQQPRKVTEKFFPDPELRINTPLFEKSSGFTSYKEMITFLEELRMKYPELIRIEAAGKTQKGKMIPLVRIGSSDSQERKVNVLLLGRVHGNEPIGTEGLLYFMQQLVENPYQKSYLNKMNFYVMPMVNIDGGEKNNRATANGIDLNRDQSKLDSPEAIAMHTAANRVNPDIFVDFHEYQPMKSDLYYISDGKILSNPLDVMFLYSSHPNVSPAVQKPVTEMFLPAIGKRMDQNGLRHQVYYTSATVNGDVKFTKGGASPRSSANIMALKNCISVLVEVRGIGLDRIAAKRRLNTVYLFADELARVAYDQSKAIKEAIHTAENEKRDVSVEFTRPNNPKQEVEFLDMIKNELVTLPVFMQFSNETTSSKNRERADAYYLLPSEKKAIAKLQLFGIETTLLDREVTLPLQGYGVLSAKESAENISGMSPLVVKTELFSRKVTLPAGTVRIDMNQRYGNLIATLLEPESPNGFVNYRVINGASLKELPIYREIK